MQDYDDEPVQRPKWIGWLIIIGMTLVVLGLLNLGVRLYLGTPSDQTTAQRVHSMAQKSPALAQAQATLEASNCMRCHGIDRKFVGPSFLQVAERYRTTDGAQAYLAHKIREGSVGTWGNTIMPRHPQVTQEQALSMAHWILAIPPKDGG